MEHTQQIKFRTQADFNPHLKRWCICVDVNFDVPPSMLLLIEIKPGVEVIQIQTRYQFVVLVGKMFEPADVQQTISDLINNWNS